MLSLGTICQAKRSIHRVLSHSYNAVVETAILATEVAASSRTHLLDLLLRSNKEAAKPAGHMSPAIVGAEYRPQMVSVVCGFAKDSDRYPQYNKGKFGEDSWFKTSTAAADVMGVADGVGGWRMFGIDPGRFSSFLMRSCERLVHLASFDPADPAQLLAHSFMDLLEQKQSVLGSCTACVLAYDRNSSILHAANIGDSGFLVVRSGAIVCRSTEQQHIFNTPFQLSVPPPGLRVHVYGDGPECADVTRFQLQVGDVIMLATDGIYDNVPESLLLDVLSEAAGIRDPIGLQMTANCLALMARMLSSNADFESPFALNARRNNVDAPGGKPDDITILLATVVD